MNNQADLIRYMQGLITQAQQNGPQYVINMLSQQNPQAARQVQEIMNQGGSFKDAAIKIMQQRGINPNLFMNNKK